MPKAKPQSPSTNHEALILVEGETELEFYKAFGERFFKGVKKTIWNLKGNFSINKKVADRILKYHHAHPSDTFDVYVCIDQERINTPAIIPKEILCELSKKQSFNGAKLKKLVPVISVLMLESLFFIDMDGIYKYLRAPKQKQTPKKYSNFRERTHKDLSTLFASFGKQYHKGSRCEGLIAHLDLEKIANQAKELANFLQHIQAT